MANRKDVTSPNDKINKLKSQQKTNDRQSLYGDDLSGDASAKAGVKDNPKLRKKAKAPALPPSEIEDKSSRRIGNDPTENF